VLRARFSRMGLGTWAEWYPLLSDPHYSKAPPTLWTGRLRLSWPLPHALGSTHWGEQEIRQPVSADRRGAAADPISRSGTLQVT
jgi:hypothetical protein